MFFRDTCTDGEANETVVHEYTVATTVDPDTMVITACDAEARVLPWVECPQAVGSAERLVGWSSTTSAPRPARSSSARAPAPTSTTSSAASKTSTGSPTSSPLTKVASLRIEAVDAPQVTMQASSLAMTSSPKRAMPSRASRDDMKGRTSTRSTFAAR